MRSINLAAISPVAFNNQPNIEANAEQKSADVQLALLAAIEANDLPGLQSRCTDAEFFSTTHAAELLSSEIVWGVRSEDIENAVTHITGLVLRTNPDERLENWFPDSFQQYYCNGERGASRQDFQKAPKERTAVSVAAGYLDELASTQDQRFSSLYSAQLRILMAWGVLEKLPLELLHHLTEACQDKGIDEALIKRLECLLNAMPGWCEPVSEQKAATQFVARCQCLIALERSVEFTALMSERPVTVTAAHLDSLYQFLQVEQAELLAKQKTLGVGFKLCDEQAFTTMANLILGAIL